MSLRGEFAGGKTGRVDKARLLQQNVGWPGLACASTVTVAVSIMNQFILACLQCVKCDWPASRGNRVAPLASSYIHIL
jgi:hypothetical protein